MNRIYKTPIVEKNENGIYIMDIGDTHILECINELLRSVWRNRSGFTFDTFKTHFPHLKYTTSKKSSIKTSSCGINFNEPAFYDAEDNIINVASVDDPDYYTYRSLLDVCSTVYDQFHNVVNMGFHQYGTHINLGKGFNHGYREVLTERYFAKRIKHFPTTFSGKIAEMIENIIGSEKMETLYCAGNLRGLVEELSQYSETEYVIHFFELLDKLQLELSMASNPISFTKKKEVLKEINSIMEFIYTCASNKALSENTNEEGASKLFLHLIDSFKSIDKAKRDSIVNDRWNIKLFDETVINNYNNGIRNLIKKGYVRTRAKK